MILRLPIVDTLKRAIVGSSDPLIQVVVGPRQVGKTTAIWELINELNKEEVHYISADGEISLSAGWVLEQWNLAAQNSKKKLLVIDEIQKVENWSEIIKKLWDEQRGQKKRLKIILLGSSSLNIQRGLKESLAGRFQMHRVYHWNFTDSQKICGLTFEEYLCYGGYPGSYRFLKSKEEWLSYIKDSLITPILSRDILSHVRVKSPALFKQCFDLVCSYPAQEISYTKILGQLQDKGNTDLVKSYLDLFEEAFLIRQLYKFSRKKVLTKKSSPKLLPLCPALYSSTLDAELSDSEKGRAFELVVGAELVRLPGQLYYWREKNFEVDYVYKHRKNLFAIEVKSGRNKSSKGLLKFKEKFPDCKTIVITSENYNQMSSYVTLET